MACSIKNIEKNMEYDVKLKLKYEYVLRPNVNSMLELKNALHHLHIDAKSFY